VSDFKRRATELAELMAEYGLKEASLSGDDWHISFRKTPASRPSGEQVSLDAGPSHVVAAPAPAAAPAEEKPAGMPISSPMTGIFYGAPSPTAAPFVKEGESVTAGQVVALIEAMKVFNEITAPSSGIVTKIVAESGQLVNPGEPLLFIG
jgi:acetyl-CoA carboxylase biotin carboxyl carrier protein